MATTAPSPKSVAITIPADYLEDVRTALIVEIENDGNALQTNQEAVTSSSRKEDLGREDRASSVRLLRNDVRLLDQLLDASGQTKVSADWETLTEVLQAMVRVLSSRLVDECGYAPVDMVAVLDLAGRLRWAARESAGIDGRDGSEAVA
jgi:hypothetical protein